MWRQLFSVTVDGSFISFRRTASLTTIEVTTALSIPKIGSEGALYASFIFNGQITSIFRRKELHAVAVQEFISSDLYASFATSLQQTLIATSDGMYLGIKHIFTTTNLSLLIK